MFSAISVMSGANMVARITPTLGACSGSPRVDSQQPKQLRAEHLKAHISSRRAYKQDHTVEAQKFCLPRPFPL